MSTDKKKKRTYASNVVLYAAFVIGAIVAINLLSTRMFGRLDLTENKVYTLSQPSKDLVKNLPDYMNVKAFISNDLPAQLKTTSRYVRDLIDEYKTNSNRFNWEAIDPGSDAKLAEEANRCNVQQLQIQVLHSQKFEAGAYYLGLCLEYGDKVEAIPQVVSVEGLEYQISSIIKKLTVKKKKIAFTTGHGESDLNQGFQALKRDLEQEFDITTVNPSEAAIGEDVDALVVGGPKQPFDEKGLREIDKFLMSGKGVVFLVDGMAMQSPGGMGGHQMNIKMAQANNTGLEKILEPYGFKVGQDFVFDPQNVPGPVELGGRQLLSNMPYFVAADTPEKSELMVLAGIRGAVFPFASSVELVGPLKDGKAQGGEGKLWRLASSSAQSWKHTGFFVLGQDKPPEPSGDRGSSALGYAYQGPLKSAYAPANAPQVSDPNAPPTESKKPVRLVVVGDSDFASDQYLRFAQFLAFYGTGAQLLFNAMSWTVEDETLTPLRAKSITARPIKVDSDAKALAIQWGNILGLPLAFCVFGLVRWRIRRRTRLAQKL